MTSKGTRRRRAGAGLLGGSLAAGLLALAAAAYAADLLIVTQREAYIRKDKRTMGPKVATVREGDQVEKLDEDDTWYQVEFKGAKGWLLKSSVSTDRKVVLSKEAVSGGVRATEQSAGGRGFNPEVEASYRASRAELDLAYKLLDRIQDRKFPEETVAQFMKDGKLGEQVAEASPRPAPSKAVSSREGRSTPPWKR